MENSAIVLYYSRKPFKDHRCTQIYWSKLKFEGILSLDFIQSFVNPFQWLPLSISAFYSHNSACDCIVNRRVSKRKSIIINITLEYVNVFYSSGREGVEFCQGQTTQFPKYHFNDTVHFMALKECFICPWPFRWCFMIPWWHINICESFHFQIIESWDCNSNEFASIRKPDSN